ncbi:hypothetical protein MMC13_003876 [Lambiella insularis]|nr:hypothetical protein [Lambiella insularis]
MPLLDLPTEIRQRILSYCVCLETDHRSGVTLNFSGTEVQTFVSVRTPEQKQQIAESELPPEFVCGFDELLYDSEEPICGDDDDTVLHSFATGRRRCKACADLRIASLPEAFPDTDFEALTAPRREDIEQRTHRQRVGRISRKLPVLFVCRQIYLDSAPIFYKENTFRFSSISSLTKFAYNARKACNNHFVRRIIIALDIWDEDIMHPIYGQPAGAGPWKAFFATKGGLNWHFPCLRHLTIEFDPLWYSPWSDVNDLGARYVDESIGTHHPICTNLPDMRATLKQYVLVKEMSVLFLRSLRLRKEMEREMMGLDG